MAVSKVLNTNVTYLQVLDHSDGWSLDGSQTKKYCLSVCGHVDGTVEEHLFHEQGGFGLVDVRQGLDDPISVAETETDMTSH